MSRPSRARRGLAVVGVAVVIAAVPACSAGGPAPGCDVVTNQLVLEAQAVPSATLVPCVASLPPGWTVTGAEYASGTSILWLDSDRAGIRALGVRLTRTCDTTRAVEVTTAVPTAGVRVFEEPIALPPAFQANRYETFLGGCVTYAFRFRSDAPATLALEVQQGLDLFPRVRIAARMADLGLTLCGADEPPCPG